MKCDVDCHDRYGQSLIRDCLELPLPAEMAFQHNEVFGSVGIDSGSLTVEENVLHIDLSLEKVIHKKIKRICDG